MTTNKRTSSSVLNGAIETKKLKTEVDSTSPTSTTVKESIPSLIDENSVKKKSCEYGEACYRQQNPKHTAEYDHPSTGASAATKNVSKRLTPVDKIDQSEPYRFLLSTVHGIQDNYNQQNAITLKEILSVEHGQLIRSAQFNYMFDIEFLLEQYPSEFRLKPLLIVHGDSRHDNQSIKNQCSPYPQIEIYPARLDIPFGTHHTKMMFLLYETGLRIVIHTANLILQDWKQKTQGIWISPICPKMNDDRESKTNFKKDLLEYIERYRARPLQFWQKTISEHDFSSINVHLISSTPGRHTGPDLNKFGHLKLRQTLKNYLNLDKDEQYNSSPIVGQFSSIGSLGPNANSWLTKEFLTSLKQLSSSSLESPELKLIYPTVENVRTSLEGYMAGGSLPYNMQNAMRQTWLVNYLHRWKADHRHRSRASPHIKTYLRATNDQFKDILWFLVTSANLSKAAWGVLEKNNTQLMIRSYEIGVLYTPKQFSKATFSLHDSPSFPIPYDLPPVKYQTSDKPWIVDVAYKDKPDSHGNMWDPSD
ncbi:unnamed protein product [Rotaria magnacalcarata]|uniref:PBZ-type domain-containing protein n=7 Tax=Rotaria magnacalcarata TaxID=392030 RepID=A0A816Z3S6_9BILA|nr:unnamed protein product [Rotaria magnacalcarata]CAF2126708.1 unnamed protein product [Rotaria magnacalcarata]CAF2182817.1 unnamed protein product [Rotaria magnacalcarata]CAF3792317.1 unnamed protein product [Rotaria magnacalcarata]